MNTSDENTNDTDYPVPGIDYLDLPESEFAWRLYEDHDPLLCVLCIEYDDETFFRVFPWSHE